MALSLRPRPERRAATPVTFTDDEDHEEPTRATRRAPVRRTKRPREPRHAPEAAEGDEAAADDDDDHSASDGSPLAKRPLVLGRTWHPHEDAALLAAFEKHPSQWKLISNELMRIGADRSTAMCRNRFQRIQAPQQPGKEGRNRCKRCGQIKRGHTCTADEVVALPLPVDGSIVVAPPPVPRAGAAAARRSPARRGLAALAPLRPAPLDGDGALAQAPLCPPQSGNAFHVDMRAFERAYRSQHDAPPEHAGLFDAPPPAFSLDELDGAGAPPFAAPPPPAAAGALPAAGYLASAAPPLVAAGGSGGRAGGPSQRSLGAISLSNLSEIDLADFVENARGVNGSLVDLADLQDCADAALASKSFKSFGAAMRALTDGAAGSDDAPPPADAKPAFPARQTTPTTLAGGDEGVAPAAAPLADAADGAAAEGAEGGAAEAVPVAPPPETPPADASASRAARLRESGGFFPAGSFASDDGFESVAVLAHHSVTRSASPIKQIPIELPSSSQESSLLDATMYEAPPLMPLPSWSRAPSSAGRCGWTECVAAMAAAWCTGAAAAKAVRARHAARELRAGTRGRGRGARADCT